MITQQCKPNSLSVPSHAWYSDDRMQTAKLYGQSQVTLM